MRLPARLSWFLVVEICRRVLYCNPWPGCYDNCYDKRSAWGVGGRWAIPYSYVRGVSGSSVNSLPGELLLGGGGERAARLGRIPHAAGLGAGVLASVLRSRARDESCVGACLRLLAELQLVRLDLKQTKIRLIRKKELSMLSRCNITISGVGSVATRTLEWKVKIHQHLLNQSWLNFKICFLH